MKYSFNLNFSIEEPLSRNIWFWLAIAVPVCIALVLATWIAFSNNLRFTVDFTLEALNNFYVYQKIPMAIAALAIPFAAIVGRQHSSAISIRQIEMVEQQNTFANYLKHREEFFKCLDRIEQGHHVKFEKRNEFYKLVYPKNSVQHVSFDSHSEDNNEVYLESLCRRFNRCISNYERTFKALYFRYNEQPEMVKGNFVEITNFYLEILRLFEQVLYLTPENSNQYDIIWVDVSPEIDGLDFLFPTKKTEPLWFLWQLQEAFAELITFTGLSSSKYFLNSFADNDARDALKMQFIELVN
ncbi:hypothetical protein [Shewanella sp. Isolate8]|uniref:hypothetical protein n=1 Tax=Shewanella sp. Isolate8 TaxID=2908529 RepID=UPI001EFCEA5A|nr:hypothetical protein [Shewanella sp. Isolate8]MCG9745959.1 hypothetical protein [Shewanella sp. Isolate8]